jgi:2-hydroxychromene-2-carboxylate isomerase
LLDRRLGSLLQDRPDIEVDRQIVTTEDDAKRLGMTGSPTIMVDGTDLFAGPDRPPSLSCRLYPDEQGRMGPAPTNTQLRQVIA